MMTFARLLSSLMFALANMDCGDETCIDKPHGSALVQSSTMLSSVVVGSDAQALSNDGPEEDDTAGDEETDEDAEAHKEYHVVCHQHGCAEVKAKLKILRSQGPATQAAVVQCGQDRSKLESELQKVATQRAKVEADLAKCGEERTALQEKVQACGTNRSALERALSQCATDRAALEQELKQCADVDRPAAEKALKECGRARAKLEQTLKELGARLANGNADKATTTEAAKTRRRRRRVSSLLETSATEGEESEAETALHSEMLHVKEQLQREIQREDDLTAAFQVFVEKTKEAESKMTSSDEEFDRITDAMEATDSQIVEVSNQVQSIADRFAEAAKTASGLKEIFDRLTDDAQKLTEEQANAVRALYEHHIAEGTAQLELLAMIQSETGTLEGQLRQKHARLTASLAQKKLLIAKKEESGDDCDDLRADIITLTGKLEASTQELHMCLSAKKEIRAKTEHAQKALDLASDGLRQCLSTKKSLTAALAECKDRCGKTQVLLKQCLARKKVLAVKIKECHEARDLARRKLQECLDRKEELKEKIAELEAKLRSTGLLQGESRAHEATTLSAAVQAVLAIMRDLDAAEARAEVEASVTGDTELAVESVEASITTAVREASEALAASAGAMQATLQAGEAMGEGLKTVQRELQQAKEDDAVADAEARGVDNAR